MVISSFVCHLICNVETLIFLLMKISKIDKKKNRHLPTSPSSPLKAQPSLNKIAIPCPSPQQQQDSQVYLNKMPEGRTNLKQLHHFLRNQIIVVKQKQRFVSNLPLHNRLNSISQLSSSITNAICLKSEKSYSQQLSGNNMPTISLPKIDNETNRRIFTDSTISQQQRVAAATEHTKSKNRESGMARSIGTHKRLRTLDSRMIIQNLPLIGNASRQITHVRQGVRDYLKESKMKTEQKASQSIDVVNFSLYRQCPQLNRISLNLAVQLAKSSNNHK